MLEDDADLQRRVQALIDTCELTNVRVVEFSGRRDLSVEATKVDFDWQTSYLVEDDRLASRYHWEAALKDDDGDLVAELAATIICEYDVYEGFRPDQEAAQCLADTSGYFAAYPYVREIFQSSCSRLQLNPMILGFLLDGKTGPRAISVPLSQSRSRQLSEGSESSRS